MDMVQHKKTLFAMSALFLFLAAANAVAFIASVAMGELTVAKIMEMAQTTQSIAQTSIIVTIVFFALQELVLLYLGWMGLRQCKDKPTGSSHIKIATVSVVVLALALAFEIVNIITANPKDWVGLCSAAASVLFGVYYIRAAKALKAQ